jgi:hypothetical protein
MLRAFGDSFASFGNSKVVAPRFGLLEALGRFS